MTGGYPLRQARRFRLNYDIRLHVGVGILKQAAVLLLLATNIALLSAAVVAYRRRSAMPDWYYLLVFLSPVLAGLLVSLGLLYLSAGRVALGMHIFYGALASVGAGGQLLLGLRGGMRHQYRARPLVHGFLALLVTLVAARAWMQS